MQPFTQDQLEYIQELISTKIQEYDFLKTFLKRIQSNDSWKDYSIEPDIRNLIRGNPFEDLYNKLPPTISKVVKKNYSLETYFYDEIFDKWFGIVPYIEPTSFAINRPEPIHNKHFTLLEFQ